MNSENFVYWINGFLELSDTKTLNEEQVNCIKEHLSLVLHKITPDKKDLKEEIFKRLETSKCDNFKHPSKYC